MAETDSITSWRAHRWPLLAYFVLGLLRLGHPLDLVEAIALTRADLAFSDWLHFGCSPGYLLLLNAWASLSVSPGWLHAFGWLTGLVGLVLTPRVLRGLGGVHAITGAMWFICCSPFIVGHVVRVSPSSLALTTIVVSCLCFLEFLRAGNVQWLVGWVAASLAAQMLHGGLYVLPLMQSACMLITRERTHARQKLWWIAQILPLALFVSLFADPLTRFLQQRIGKVPAPMQIVEALGRVAGGMTLSVTLATAALILFLIVLGLRAQQGNRRDPKRILLTMGWLVPGAIWLLWLPYPFYALIAAVFLAVVVSTGIRTYPQWGRQVLWTAIFAVYAWGHVAVLR